MILILMTMVMLEAMETMTMMIVNEGIVEMLRMIVIKVIIMMVKENFIWFGTCCSDLPEMCFNGTNIHHYSRT